MRAGLMALEKKDSQQGEREGDRKECEGKQRVRKHKGIP